MMRSNTHENHSGSHETKMGSERSFGIVFAFVFALIAGWSLYQVWPEWRESNIGLFALGFAVLFTVLALAAPDTLKAPNVLWFKLGLVLHKLMSPLLLGLLFFLTVTPTALIMKLLGKDPLCLRLDPDAESYWIHRDTPGPEPKSMSRQF